jgi:hypothetical protein
MRRWLPALIVAIVLVGHAQAQDVGAILGAAALPPPSTPAPPAAYTFFSDIFNAVDGTIQDAAAPIVAGAAAHTRTILVAAITLWLACWCASELFPSGSGGSMFFTGLFRQMISGAIALSAVQIYADQVMPFLLTTMPGELAGVFTFGGTPQAGATVAANFDKIWNATIDLANLVADRIPDALSLTAIKLMFEVGILKLLSEAFIWWGYAVFWATHMVQTVLGIIGIVFVALWAIPPARKYAWGWGSALLATICTTTILSLILGLMLGVVTKQYQFLSGLPETTVFAAQSDGFAKVVGALFLLATLMTVAPFIGLAIFGGVHNSISGLSTIGGAILSGGRKLVGAIR